jgi:tRNA-2-methylthio-N6-dimethylallyladenosine synthase
MVGRSMTDHIVVFDGTERLIGETVTVDVDDASSFTLFGSVRTNAVSGVELREPRERVLTSTRIGLEMSH